MNCPNCGQPVENGKKLCPNCGAGVGAVWPPPPLNAPPVPMPPTEKLITGSVKGDTALGIGVGIVLMCIPLAMCLSVLVIPIIYAVSQHHYSVFARWLGLGYVLGFGGAFLVCFGPSVLSR